MSLSIQQIKEVERSNKDNWIFLHSSYERKSFKVFKSALKVQINPVVKYLKTYGVPSNGLIDLLITKLPMEIAYKEVYLSIGVKHAGATYRQINAIGRAMKSANFFSETWRKLMESFFYSYSSERISEVTDTTRERIKNLLANNSNLPISQQASLLESEDFTRARALTIARTESTAAANYGASIGNESADYETNKQWLSILDSNTRPDHITADGQTVPNDENFIVGGYECRFPGDLTLPAKECINCRCSVMYVPIVGENGLPILKD